jgi:dienelactone hydrolase
MMVTSGERSRIRELLNLREPESYRPTGTRRRGVVRLAAGGGVGCEEITLTTADGDDIPCLFLTPASDPPWGRAVIAVHQHAGDFSLGKSEPAGLAGDPTLAFGRRLAEAGIPTLLPDLVGFGERRRPGTAAHRDPAEAERLDAAARARSGDSLQAKHTRDVAVATSWLQDNLDIRGPLGIMGHSLGGQVALFALAVDPRLRAGVISCGLGTIASFRAHNLAHNPAWFVPELENFGDVPAVAAALSGQRVFVSAGFRDPWFPPEGVREVVAGFAGGVCDFHPVDGAHGMPAAVSADAIRWLAERLRHGASPGSQSARESSNRPEG